METIPLLDGEIIARGMEKINPALTCYVCMVCMYASYPTVMVMSDCSDG